MAHDVSDEAILALLREVAGSTGLSPEMTLAETSVDSLVLYEWLYALEARHAIGVDEEEFVRGCTETTTLGELCERARAASAAAS
jgi:hypothetical protein